MPDDNFQDDFQEELSDGRQQEEKIHTMRLLITILVAGILGIAVSSGAVYFLSGEKEKLANISEKLGAAIGGAIKVREIEESFSENTTKPSSQIKFSSPKLSRRISLPSPSMLVLVPPQSSPFQSPSSQLSQSSSRFGKILISEIQIAGESSGDEFIEFYNPNDFAVSLDGWSVKKKSSGGKEYVLISQAVFKDKSIAPKSYLLAARNEAKINALADIFWPESNTIAEDNTIILYGKLNNELVIVDAVGFGDAYEFEGSPAANPAKGQTLSRKNIDDTDNNREDFIISIPTPRNAASGIGFVEPKAAPSPTLLPSPSSSPIFQSSSSPSSPEPSPSPTSSPSPSPSPSPTPSHSPPPEPSSSLSPSPLSSPAASPSPTPSPSPSPVSEAIIRINEILFNPAGSDEGKEFIELINIGSSNLDIKGWSLRLQSPDSTSSTSLISFGAKAEDITVIPMGGYLLIGFNAYNSTPTADAVRSASLPNTSRTILLLNQEGNLIDMVTYDASIPEGSSWERLSPSSEQFHSQSSPSPTNSSRM